MSGSEGEGDPSSNGQDAMDEGEAAAPPPRAPSARAKQNTQLYASEGQFNPHAARAERKRRKKAAARGGDEAYDWNEHFEADAGAAV